MTAVTSPRELGEFRVWTIPASTSFDFAFTRFVHQQRLIPESIRDTAGGRGSASFRLLRALREENGVVVNDGEALAVGCYIAVTKGIATETFDETKAIFWGYIATKNLVQLEGQSDVIGVVTAGGLGTLMDTIQLSGFRQAESSGGASFELSSAPTFNLEGDGGVIIGNYITDSDGKPVLAGVPSLCSPSSLWSRKRVLDHIFSFCAPPGMPAPLYSSLDSGVASYMESTADREVFDLSGLTLAGAVDLLIPRGQGMGWKVLPTTDSGVARFRVTAYPLIDSVPAEYGTGYPAATIVNITADDIESDKIGFSVDANDIYDSITVEGDNILVGASVSFADQNIVKGWTTAQETAYRAGASAATGYSMDMLDDQRHNRNEELRNSSGLSDVYQLITLKMDSTRINRSTSPGDVSASMPLVPKMIWDGVSLAESSSIHATPYLPGARLSRVVPWLVGVSGDGTDTRDATIKARPEYLKPRVFRYDTTAPTFTYIESICADLLVPSTIAGKQRPSPTVTPDDRCPGLRIAFSPNEFMAKNHWVDATDAITRIGTVTSNTRAIDYTKLLLTIGIPSDQKVSVTVRRAGVAAGAERAELVVRDKKLQCWAMLRGSVVGTNKEGDADRVLATTFVRNDFPTAQRMATAIAAFAFRKRTAVTMTLAEPDNLPSWAVIGTMIGQITEATYGNSFIPNVVADAYTVVESIDYDLRYESPRVTITTTLPPTPKMGGGSSSPAQGGSVSSSLGGTVAQATQAAQAQGRDNAARGASVPTTVGVSPFVVVASQVFVIIDKGNTLDGGSGVDGIKHLTTEITSLPSAYDPNVTSTFINGIGRGTLVRDGVIQSGYVLVCNDVRSLWSHALLQGDGAAISGTAAIANGSGFSLVYIPV